jgi:hypothetical protein
MNFEVALTPSPGWHPYISVKLPTLIDEVVFPRVADSYLVSSGYFSRISSS